MGPGRAGLRLCYREGMEETYSFTCPYCWQPNDFTVDVSAPHQTLIQDCEVCCHPIEIEYALEGGEIALFEARPV